ncbi:MAG: GNAT family N-acetyltransferase [Streptococcaceae bacterium]|jgi:N-acetylglutamate synthase-like GNAT family acetyltransferase|nr:GNAT family N-acetyltransferase [Streptococcaceae bacterium]
MIAIDIREYDEAYKNQVIDLILEIQQQEFSIPISREDQPDLENIENFYQTGNGNFWIALRDGEVVGTVALKDIGNHQAALRKMFVKASYRGKASNAAQMLLQCLLDWAEKHEFTTIYLGTTAQFLAAHRFYEKNGFVQIAKEELPSNFQVLKVDTRFYKMSIDKD